MQLRSYQEKAVERMVGAERIINASDMGVGKTLETLVSIDTLGAYPCLVVCPKFALMVWQSEIKKWLDTDSLIYTGKPKERQEIWKQFREEGPPFLITNFAMLPELLEKDRKYNWAGVVCDEIHTSGLLNHKTKTYKALKALCKQAENKVLYLLTGTLVRKGCIDLFAPLSLIDGTRFKSYWSYVRKYCVVTQTYFGKQIERNPSNVKAFRKMLQKYVIRDMKEDCLKELPGKQRQCLYVNMSKKQQKMYEELTEDLMTVVPDSQDLIITPNQLSLMIRQRQLLACPQELGLTERGAAIDTLLEHSHLKLDEGNPIVIFTPFRKALKWLQKAFKEEYPNCKTYEIKGQLTAQEFGDAWQGFQNDKAKQKILFCVIKSGASFQATAADTAYFLGYEWDFNLNVQAEDRLNRIGQENFVNVYYLMHKGTVDEHVAERLSEKNDANTLILGSEKQYIQFLKSRRRA